MEGALALAEKAGKKAADARLRGQIEHQRELLRYEDTLIHGMARNLTRMRAKLENEK